MQLRRTAEQRHNRSSRSGGTGRSLQATLSALPTSNPRAKGNSGTPPRSHAVVQTVESPAQVNVNQATQTEAPVQPSSFLRSAVLLQTEEVRAVEEVCMPEFPEVEVPEVEPNVSQGVAKVETEARPRVDGATTTPLQYATSETTPTLPPKSPRLESGRRLTQNPARSTFQSASHRLGLQTAVGAVGGRSLQKPNECAPSRSR